MDEQHGVPTFYDYHILKFGKEISPAWETVLDRHDRWDREGRYVDYSQRRSVHPDGLQPIRNSEISIESLLMSQGRGKVMSWAGVPLFKSVFEFALMPMLLSELKPSTIIEVGSGFGASAAWLADTTAQLGFPCSVISIDIDEVSIEHPKVEFIHGNAQEHLHELLSRKFPDGPRLIVEDAHECVDEVLSFSHDWLNAGDYLVVEDSIEKESDLRKFSKQHTGTYCVDTKYTDFFGRNSTNCVDSIFRKMHSTI